MILPYAFVGLSAATFVWASARRIITNDRSSSVFGLRSLSTVVGHCLRSSVIVFGRRSLSSVVGHCLRSSVIVYGRRSLSTVVGPQNLETS
jgi:hypothetical protein